MRSREEQRQEGGNPKPGGGVRCPVYVRNVCSYFSIYDIMYQNLPFT